MNTSELQMLTIATSVYEDMKAWENLRIAFKETKKSNKSGTFSIHTLCREIGLNIYSQLKSLTIDELEIVKKNFTEQQWDTISFIVNEYKPVNKEQNLNCV